MDSDSQNRNTGETKTDQSEERLDNLLESIISSSKARSERKEKAARGELDTTESGTDDSDPVEPEPIPDPYESHSSSEEARALETAILSKINDDNDITEDITQEEDPKPPEEVAEDDEEAENSKFSPEDTEKAFTKKDLMSLVIYVVLVFALTFVIVHYVGQRTRVSGSSMEATLSDGDNLIVDKISYRFSDPKRFDIIIFPPRGDEDTYYIKRIIGLPGETVQIDTSGTIYINGKVLDESYGLDVIVDPGSALDPITLGKDEYFVLGDNRNNSTDSRWQTVGAVEKKDIIGRAWVRIYPFNKMKFLTTNK